jgi:hypothetical protein
MVAREKPPLFRLGHATVPQATPYNTGAVFVFLDTVIPLYSTGKVYFLI